MPDARPDAPTWIDRLGLSPPGQLALLVLAAGAFLAAPDVDLLLLPILHHRSILTHSVLLPLLVLLARRQVGTAPAAGAAVGVAVHLAADLLSPPRGFGQVWLPEPWQVPLGAWSPAWIGANAVAAAWLAFALAARGPRGASRAAGATALAAAVGYGVLNERSVLAVAAAGAVLAAGWALHRRLSRSPGPARP